jgi:fibronectin type 3 domain-containing protein
MLFFSLNNLKRIQNKAALAFIFFALLISFGCGKRKPPLPPIERVAQRVEISGFQRGNKILLSWTMATRNASDGSLLNIRRADIYRLAEPLNSTSDLSEEDFASRSTLIKSVPIEDTDFARKQLSYTDSLTFAGQPAKLIYAVRFVNASGQKAAFSNFLVIEPTAKVAQAPADVKLTVNQNAVVLNWDAPTANIDNSQPANIIGYNIYRIDDEKDSVRLLNASPITNSEYADKFFEFEKSYTYFLRTVSLGADSEPTESADSNNVKTTPKDTFPPSAPSAVTIAASPNTISIFFATNPENDIAGYRIYRSNDPNLPKAEWSLLTPQLLTTNTFQDTNIESGKKYFYYLTAVDKFGNASNPSESVSEIAP